MMSLCEQARIWTMVMQARAEELCARYRLVDALTKAKQDETLAALARVEQAIKTQKRAWERREELGLMLEPAMVSRANPNQKGS